MFLQVRWPNQQCQRTEGGWLVIQIAVNLTRLISPCYNNTTCVHILEKSGRIYLKMQSVSQWKHIYKSQMSDCCTVVSRVRWWLPRHWSRTARVHAFTLCPTLMALTLPRLSRNSTQKRLSSSLLPRSLILCTGNWTYSSVDNLVTFSGRKAHDMSKVSECCRIKVQNLHSGAFKYSLPNLH